MEPRDALAPAAIALSAAAMAGCQFPPVPPPAAQPRAATVGIAPCADRLHDLAGELLLYYVKRGDLPGTLSDLKGDAGPPVKLVCPVTGKPYLYRRQGVPVAGRAGRLIVWDAESSPNGLRWGILLEPPQPGQPLVLRVAHLPDKTIQWDAQVPGL